MSLKAKIKDLEGQITGEPQDGAAKNEAEDQPEPKDEGAEEGKQPAPADPAKDAEPKAGNEKDAKPKEKQSFAKLRVDTRKTNKEDEIADLRNQINELKTAKPAAVEPKPGEDDPEPDKTENYEGWLEWELRRTNRELSGLKTWQEETVAERKARQEEEEKTQNYRQAQQEIIGFMAEFQKEREDAKDVFAHLDNVLSESVRNLYPHLNATQVQQAVNNKVIEIAAAAYNKGYDPASVLYQLGLDRGFQPKEAAHPAQQLPPKQEAPRPNLKKIDDAKRKSASPAAGGRNPQVGMTVEDFRKLSTAKKAKLTKAQIDALIEG